MINDVIITLLLVLLYLIVIGYMYYLITSKLVPIRSHKTDNLGITNSLVCYVINLPKDSDRLSNFTRLYRDSDLNSHSLITVEGVNGRALAIQDYITPDAYNEIELIEKNNYRTKHHQLTRGAVGCYLSHLKAQNLIMDSGNYFGVIFEDDALITPNVHAAIQYSLRIIPVDWDIILLGSIAFTYTDHELYRKIKSFWGLWGYMINIKAIATLQQYAGKPFDRQIDHQVTKLISEGKLKVYAPPQDYVFQSRDFGSNIQTPLKHVEGINPFDIN